MEFITRKIGPLPTWGWAAIIVGGFVLYRLRQQNKAAAANANDLYGGELSPEYNPGYPGNDALGPDSLIPLSAISQTNGGTSTDPNQPISAGSGSGTTTGTYYRPGQSAPTPGTSGSGPGGEQRVSLTGSTSASTAPSQSVAIGGLPGGTGFFR